MVIRVYSFEAFTLVRDQMYTAATPAAPRAAAVFTFQSSEDSKTLVISQPTIPVNQASLVFHPGFIGLYSAMTFTFVLKEIECQLTACKINLVKRLAGSV